MVEEPDKSGRLASVLATETMWAARRKREEMEARDVVFVL